MFECVLNFSEGEDASVIGQIVSAVKTAKVLDVHSDPDHNRSVVTMIGDKEGIRAAAFDLTKRAVQLLDINEHAGVHPYIGVVDVIPFIPLGDSTIKEAVAIAYKLGEKFWREIKLPVYYYGDAAIISERKDLPYVRKGGYKNLKEEINEKHRKPDVGEGLHQNAGAVAVGARNFLIAFNINLKTQDLDIARSIAKNIREKDGGLPGVRALGLELLSKKCTQVSINITNHKETSIIKVFDQVKSWAKEYQVEIIGSELVGMIPKEATFPDMNEYLNIKNWHESLIIDQDI